MGTLLIVKINFILSLAYNDVIVPCNVPDVCEFRPLWACGCLWSANEPQTIRISLHLSLFSMYWAALHHFVGVQQEILFGLDMINRKMISVNHLCCKWGARALAIVL